MKLPSIDDIERKAASALFGKKLLTNVHRAIVAEAIVAAALEPDWEWCSADYASYDFRRNNVRLEVKQSAALQSWNAVTLKQSKCTFDIAERTGEWVDVTTWKPGVGHNADMYVLCHHPIASPDADHRDASQWRFFILAESVLPKQKRISLSRVESITEAVSWADLGTAVNRAANDLNVR